MWSKSPSWNPKLLTDGNDGIGFFYHDLVRLEESFVKKTGHEDGKHVTFCAYSLPVNCQYNISPTL